MERGDFLKQLSAGKRKHKMNNLKKNYHFFLCNFISRNDDTSSLRANIIPFLECSQPPQTSQQGTIDKPQRF